MLDLEGGAGKEDRKVKTCLKVHKRKARSYMPPLKSLTKWKDPWQGFIWGRGGTPPPPPLADSTLQNGILLTVHTPPPPPPPPHKCLLTYFCPPPPPHPLGDFPKSLHTWVQTAASIGIHPKSHVSKWVWLTIT